MGLIDSLTQIGPMARFVNDVAMVLPIISGVDWHDPAAAPVPLANPDDVHVNDLRLAYYTDNGVWAPHADVAKATIVTAQALEESGMNVEENLPTAIREVADFHTRLRTADGGWTLTKLLEQTGTEQAGSAFQRRIDNAVGQDIKALAELLMEGDRIKTHMLEFMQDYDAIVCPPCAHPPWKHGSGVNMRYEEWAYGATFNFLGWPAIVLRAGTSAEGLPIGVQIVGKPWREDVVLALALEVERHCGGYQPPE